MKLLSILFLASLLLGQVGGITVYPNVVIYIHDLILAVLLVEGFVQYAMRGKIKLPALLAPAALFVAIAVISLLTNSGVFLFPTLALSSLYLLRWVGYFMIYVLVLQPFTASALWLYGLYSVGVGLGVVGLFQFFLYPDLRNLSYLGWDPHFYRLFSTFLDPNFAGIFLVLTLFLGVYLWQEIKLRIWIGAGEIVTLVSLLLTYSRSSYLALIGGLVLFAVLKKQWLVMLGILVFIAVVVWLPKTPGSTLNLLRTDSTFARLGNWQEGIALIRQSPVLGHGFDTLRYLTTDNGTEISKSAAGLDSSLLFVGATTGVIGLAAYIFLIWQTAKIGVRLAARKKEAVLGMVLLMSLTALGVHSLFVNSAFYAWIMIWMWILVGVAERYLDSKIRSG